MTKQDFVQGMAILAAAFQNFRADQEAVEVWYMFFEDEDKQPFYEAIKTYIKNGKFAPTIADLKGLIADSRYKGPDPAMEFERVRAMVRKFGWANPDDAEKALGPETWDAIRKTGGWMDFCKMTDDNRRFIKKEFEAHLVITQKRQREQVLIGGPGLVGIAG